MSVDLDKQIDRAVREMLDVEPPADLRARVIAQLPAPGSRLPAFGFRLPASGLFPLVASAFRRNRLVFASAAAAVIVLAIFLARRTEPLPQGSALARADRYLAPETAVPSPVIEPPAAIPPVPVTAPARRLVNRGTVAAASFDGDEHATAGIAPLKTIAPIAMTPIAQNSIAPAEIAVRPLTTITEVQIAPMTSPERRD